ncbi:GtrA family protein [Caenimonas soli]|uniref:GtrA family protein n=1 Tax=Caenimonas soli TaxID=2735555 RepID=UPI0015553AAF|nr:GtrA family protein [Caenimonas soli]NPC57290.1 GtrA family protein [Caenimonas soli]
MSAQLPMPGSSRFLRFVLVGAVGFVVDAGVLQGLISVAGWGPVGARAVALPLAIFATWLLNRTITFPESHGGPPLASLMRYAAVSAVGASANFIIYSLLVFASQAMAALPILPLAIASVIALVVNYLGSKHFAFR